MTLRASLSVPLLLMLLTCSGSALAKPPHKAAPRAAKAHGAAPRAAKPRSAATAAAKPAATAAAKTRHQAVHHPRRPSDRLDAMRTKQERARNVQVLKTVTVVGHPQRPLAVFDINVKPFRFPVGTARYSPRDQRFVPRGRERW